MKHSIVHHALLQFLLHADPVSRAVSGDQLSIDYHVLCFPSSQELIEGVREVLVEMLHTRDGAKVALQCIWHGTTKVRGCGLKGKVMSRATGPQDDREIPQVFCV